MSSHPLHAIASQLREAWGTVSEFSLVHHECNHLDGSPDCSLPSRYFPHLTTARELHKPTHDLAGKTLSEATAAATGLHRFIHEDYRDRAAVEARVRATLQKIDQKFYEVAPRDVTPQFAADCIDLHLEDLKGCADLLDTLPEAEIEHAEPAAVDSTASKDSLETTPEAQTDKAQPDRVDTSAADEDRETAGSALRIDEGKAEILYRGRALRINSHSDFTLLSALITAEGRIVPYLELLSAIKPGTVGSMITRMREAPSELKDVAHRVRGALKRAGSAGDIKAVRGKGYRLL